MATVECGQIHDSLEMAQVYLTAFPESKRFFYPNKRQHKLLELVSYSFQSLFYLGGRALVIRDDQGKTIAYCLYKSSLHPCAKDWLALIKASSKALVRLNPLEFTRLTLTKGLIFCTTKKDQNFRDYQATGEILSIAVHPDKQGEGLGSALLEVALQQLAGEAVSLNVRGTNLAGLSLYEKNGFIKRGSNRDFLGEWLMLIKPAD